MPAPRPKITAEERRLAEDARRRRNWKRWGPYLSERQWATVREDYSPEGDCWNYFPHDLARSRAYRWGEDGLLGITDRECRLCFALALWNHRDPILKERLFGLTGPEGNHGEDVKECYYYLDSTPTHSYMKALYKYPQAEFPYAQLVAENRRRSRAEPEYELEDTGVFADERYFDVQAEYAKAGPDDLLIRITVANRGPETADVTVLPTLWFRNAWIWGCTHEGCELKPLIAARDARTLVADHVTLGTFYLIAHDVPTGPDAPELLVTENETNAARCFGVADGQTYVKDAFHRYVIAHETTAVNPRRVGTKAAWRHELRLAPGQEAVLRLRLTNQAATLRRPWAGFDALFARRQKEADSFYAALHPAPISAEGRRIARQASAGLLWSKQFYHYVVASWLDGDPAQPPPPASRQSGRNADWRHVFTRDVLSMPDKWEYPWFAAWDLAFHAVAFAHLDDAFAKSQLELLLREWYMHPNGHIPAYEFGFSEVNPPVHAWAAWRVYKMTAPRGRRDVAFLERCFHKLMLNFTWWVNRKDVRGRHLFSGGFLGLDNIGIFDRSSPQPDGDSLEQADGTAWMAFYCSTMLAIALELALYNQAYEDIASKFFEHFVAIVDAINTLGGTGLWDERDGFYYDHLRTADGTMPLRVRSLVGLVPLFAVEIFDHETIERLPGFAKRLRWFMEFRRDLARNITYMETDCADAKGHFLLAVPTRARLQRVLACLFNPDEFLSPFGIRSVSRVHQDHPFVLQLDGRTYQVRYSPGESDTAMFGGNSNWRGPIWFPMNYLLIEALERYDHFYGPTLRLDDPARPGRQVGLAELIADLRRRLVSIFLPDPNGRRPCHGDDPRYATNPHWRDLLLFHEYFHADTGRGLGASHQTGWTALCTLLLR